MNVRITLRAQRHIRDAVRWRDENMDADASDKFMDEILATIRLIQRHPGIGTKVLNARSPGALRVLMKAVDSFLYYRVNLPRQQIEVLAVRHTSRGIVPGI